MKISRAIERSGISNGDDEVFFAGWVRLDSEECVLDAHREAIGVVVVHDASSLVGYLDCLGFRGQAASSRS